MTILFNTDLEEVIIGELWLDDRNIYVPSLNESLFTTAQGKLLLGIFKKYLIRNDLFALKSSLEMDGYAGVTDILHYLLQCSNKAVHVLKLPDHIKILKEIKLRQRLLDMAQAETITDDDIVEIHKLTAPGNYRVYIPETLKELSLNFPKDYEKRVETYRNGVPYPTGFYKIDQKIGGILLGNITLIGGRTSYGKSALMTNIAVNLVKKNVSVLYLSCEMKPTDLFDRVIASQATIESFDIKYAQLNLEEQKTISETLGRDDFYLKPLKICYTPGLTLSSIQMLVEEIRPKILVIDHVQIMRFKGSNRAQDMEDTAYQLKDMAGEYDTGIILGSQVNREAVKGKQNTTMQPAYYKGSGGLEDASSACLELKLSADSDRDASDWHMDLEIQKSRFGPVGILKMIFERQYARFREEI